MNLRFDVPADLSAAGAHLRAQAAAYGLELVPFTCDLRPAVAAASVAVDLLATASPRMPLRALLRADARCAAVYAAALRTAASGSCGQFVGDAVPSAEVPELLLVRVEQLRGWLRTQLPEVGQLTAVCGAAAALELGPPVTVATAGCLDSLAELERDRMHTRQGDSTRTA